MPPFGSALGMLLFGVLVVVVLFASLTWTQGRSASMMEQWASENGYQLISSSRCYFTLGTPFWAANMKRHMVYRITVQDAYNNTMSGYALCGGYFLGMWSNNFE